MTTLAEIFDLRRLLDAERQPSYAATLARLPALLDDLRVQHPYELRSVQEATLFTELGCAVGPSGEPATLPATEYLYRLTSLGSVMYATGWDEPVPDTHARLLLAHGAARDWLPLSGFATGSVQNERDFSWWTTLDTILREPYTSGHQLGLVDNWIAVHALVLRCAITDVVAESLACVPSVTDAICLPVFAATKASLAPSAGVTIDLRGTGPVAHGAPEFALRRVRVELIDFIPLLIQEEDRTPPRVPKDSTTWRRLKPFYESLSSE